ncbi:PREDICTED: putative nuclease HARBI1 [Cyphomyrmex costatus]|uniref:putative nuclease HARBI1 n=1 Tax=Cyphomyrmex costatus TaxID=456900 RepID=UPI000852431F|nr:PREDICTED: putative nuclease HARBI1 [Cyphomyrmex costatus]
MLATPDSYRSVYTKFDIGKATAWRCVLKVVKALYKLRNVFISWPTREQAEATWTKIELQHQFPGVIGIVDGTLVKIPKSKIHPEAYICRKNYHAIQLQVVCNADMRFIHCYAGQPGSVHETQGILVSWWMYLVLHLSGTISLPFSS